MKSIFCDIDGTILRHHGSLSTQIVNPPELLEGVLKKFNEWDKKRYNIILITARRESLRELTENQLANLGIFYDHLIMGLGGGDRILVNDRKLDNDKDTAYAVNLDRNEGLKNVKE